MTITKNKKVNTQNESKNSNFKQSTLIFNQNKSKCESSATLKNLDNRKDSDNKNDSDEIKEKILNKPIKSKELKEKIFINLDNSFEKLPPNKNNFLIPQKSVNVNSPRSQSCRPKNTKLQKAREISFSNHNLLNLWDTVRRSERLPDKINKEQKERSVIKNIRNRKEEGLRIINTVDKGRGVECTVPFSKDSFIVEYAGDLITEKEAISREAEYQKDPTKGSYMYHFKHNNAKLCVDATAESGRLGRLLNHSKLRPNCYVKVIPIDNTPRLTIYAKRDIDIGEELIYDYGDRDKATVDANPWLKY